MKKKPSWHCKNTNSGENIALFQPSLRFSTQIQEHSSLPADCNEIFRGSQDSLEFSVCDHLGKRLKVVAFAWKSRVPWQMQLPNASLDNFCKTSTTLCHAESLLAVSHTLGWTAWRQYSYRAVIHLSLPLGRKATYKWEPSAKEVTSPELSETYIIMQVEEKSSCGWLAKTGHAL